MTRYRALHRIWEILGLAQCQTLIALLSLAVTAILTVYIFRYTNLQNKAQINIATTVVPTKYTTDGRQWDVSLNIHNFGPADATTATLFVQTTHKGSITFVGYAQHDFASLASQQSEPQDLTPASREAPQGSVLVDLGNFEQGDNHWLLLVFEVKEGANDILESKWDALGLEPIADPVGGGHYFNWDDIDQDERHSLVKEFIEGLSVTGQNINLTWN